MALTFSQTTGDIKNIMDTLPSNDLQEIIKHANTLMAVRTDQRRKELWGNVVAALQKYGQEVEEIEIKGDIDYTLCVDADSLETPGTLYIAF